jgi:hypothetical protein
MAFILLKTESILSVIHIDLPVTDTLLVYWNLPAERFGAMSLSLSSHKKQCHVKCSKLFCY